MYSEAHDELIDGRSVLCVVILYYPSKSDWIHVDKVIQQVNKVLLLDNTPGADIRNEPTLNAVNDNICYHKFGENKGIGYALNFAANYAIERGFTWLLTMDQDSELPEQYIDSMFKVLNLYPNPDEVDMLCPSIGSKKNVDPKNWERVNRAITSGTLMRIEMFEKIGLFNEYLFIDYVDFDYCLRARAAGSVILQLPWLHLKHTIGSPTEINIIFGVLKTLNHSPVRRYYKFRNRIWMTKKYFSHYPAWILHEFLAGFYEVAKIMMFESQKMSKIHMIIRGTIDGIIGRLGPYLTGESSDDGGA